MKVRLSANWITVCGRTVCTATVHFAPIRHPSVTVVDGPTMEPTPNTFELPIDFALQAKSMYMYKK
jgi:hypothetical protein